MTEIHHNNNIRKGSNYYKVEQKPSHALFTYIFIIEGVREKRGKEGRRRGEKRREGVEKSRGVEEGRSGEEEGRRGGKEGRRGGEKRREGGKKRKGEEEGRLKVVDSILLSIPFLFYSLSEIYLESE